MLPPKAWWLSLSPDETKLAYIYWNGEALEIVLRDLATGAERQAKLEASLDDSQAGVIVWSPDGQTLMLTVAIHPCDTANWANSVVRVESAKNADPPRQATICHAGLAGGRQGVAQR